MDINDLFDGIIKSINQFADEIAEQRLQEKMQNTGRGPENGGKNAENIEAKETKSPGAILDSRRLVAKRQGTGNWPATGV